MTGSVNIYNKKNKQIKKTKLDSNYHFIYFTFLLILIRNVIRPILSLKTKNKEKKALSFLLQKLIRRQSLIFSSQRAPLKKTIH